MVAQIERINLKHSQDVFEEYKRPQIFFSLPLKYKRPILHFILFENSLNCEQKCKIPL